MHSEIKIDGTEKVQIYPTKVDAKPIVSVCVQTYNHENYIKKCLDSILMQKTNFEYEILLGEDDSKDKTREICIDYAKLFPKKIRLFLHDRSNVIYINVNPTGRYNFLYNLKNAKGKYLAFCEGDDYWTDPYKLQKQVDFLRQNADYNMTVGRTRFFYENSKTFKDKKNILNTKKEILIKDYIAYNFAHLSTFLFRNNFVVPDWFSKVHAGDQSLFIVGTSDRKIKYFNDLFSVYRINPSSISFKADSIIAKQNTSTFLNYIDQYTDGKYKLLIKNRRVLNNLYFHFATSKNPLIKKSIQLLMYAIRWLGINVLTKIIKN